MTKAVSMNLIKNRERERRERERARERARERERERKKERAAIQPTSQKVRVKPRWVDLKPKGLG
jgi:hypothetical protein